MNQQPSIYKTVQGKDKSVLGVGQNEQLSPSFLGRSPQCQTMGGHFDAHPDSLLALTKACVCASGCQGTIVESYIYGSLIVMEVLYLDNDGETFSPPEEI